MATVPKSDRTTKITLASASAGPFDLSFRLFDTDDITVFVNDLPREDFTLSASFTDGFDDSATITFDAALDDGDVIIIDGDLSPRRDQDYLNGPSLTEKLNIEFGRLWATLAEVKRDTKRSLRALFSVSPFAVEAGRSVIVNDTADGFTMGATSDEIENAQTYATNAATSASSASTSATAAAASAADAADLLENVLYSLKTADELIADTVLSYTAAAGKKVVATDDIVSAGNYFYEVAASGASDEHVTTAGGVKLYVRPIGGVYNVEAWGTVTSTTFNTAAAQVADIAWDAAEDGDAQPHFILRCASKVSTDEELLIQRSGGGRTKGLQVDLSLMFIKAVAGGSLSDTDPVLRINSRTAKLYVGFIECDRVCCGVHFDSCLGAEISLNGVKHWPISAGDVGYGMRMDGDTGGIHIRKAWGIQWDTADAEAIAALESNYTGRLYWLDGIDFSGEDMGGGWCGVPFYFGSNCSLCFLHNIHPYNGSSVFVRNDTTIIENHSSGQVYISDSYMDNGLIHAYSPRLHLTDCHMLELSSKVTLSDPEVRVYCTAGLDGTDPTCRFHNNTGMSIGYFDAPTGGYAWGGDYSEVANSYDEQNLSGVITQHAQREINIYPRDDDVPHRQNWRAGGKFVESFYSGTDTASVEMDPASGEYTISMERLIVGDWQIAGATDTLTVTSNTITPYGHFHRVDTSSAAVTIATIDTANAYSGATLILSPSSNSNAITLNETDNLKLDAATITLDNIHDTIMLMKFGSNWRQIAWSNND